MKTNSNSNFGYPTTPEKIALLTAARRGGRNGNSSWWKGLAILPLAALGATVFASCATNTPRTGSWQFEKLHTPSKDVWGNAVDFDKNGKPVFVYKRRVSPNDNGIEFAEMRNGTWKFEVVDTEEILEPFGGALLAVDSQGDPHILYLKRNRIRYASRSGGAWKSEIVDDSWNVGGGLGLVLDANDQPRILHAGHSGDTNVYLSTRKGGKWSKEVVEGGVRAGSVTGICLNSQGILGVVYFSENNNVLRIARQRNGGWAAETVVTAKPREFIHPAIALDQNGNFVVAYASGSPERYGLYFARENANGAWVTSQLSNGPAPFLSLKRNDRTKNVFMLRDSVKGIVLSENAGNGWRDEVLLNGPDTTYCEFAISPDGEIVVSTLVRHFGGDSLEFASRK
jgi:hypothetical protein